MFVYWAHQGSAIHYSVSGPAQPGEYLLLMRYTADGQPSLPMQVEVENGIQRQARGPISLPPTSGWPCFKIRTAELGQFEIGPGSNKITIHSLAESTVNLYSLLLVRLPASSLPKPANFSFNNFLGTANRISLDAIVPQDGFVLINEIYYPGWEATVDGKPVEILRADGIFRALFVPAGSHHLEFRFRPRHFALGAAISLLTLVGFIVYTVAWLRRRPEDGTIPRADTGIPI